MMSGQKFLQKMNYEWEMCYLWTHNEFIKYYKHFNEIMKKSTAYKYNYEFTF